MTDKIRVSNVVFSAQRWAEIDARAQKTWGKLSAKAAKQGRTARPFAALTPAAILHLALGYEPPQHGGSRQAGKKMLDKNSRVA